MADGYNVIQDPGVNQLLTRRLNTLSGPASALAPEVMPVFPAAQYDATFDWVAGIRRALSAASITAAAGTFAGLRLANPSGSQTLMVVEQMLVSSEVASGLRWGTTNVVSALAGGAVASAPRDTRQPSNTATTQTTGVVTVTNAAGTPTFTTNGIASGFVLNQVNIPILIPLGFVLSPGNSFEIWANVVNQGLRATLFWSERRAQPSELV